MMTSTIRKFGVGVASLALVASATAPAFAANENLREVPGPLDGLVDTGRLGGYDRIDTAIAIAEKAFGDTPDQVEVAYIASSETVSTVDSAAAGHLSDGPIYLVAGDNRSQDAVANSINKNFPNVQKIVAIGGTKAVSDATLKGVSDKVLADTTTQRVSGKDRYETAAAIAEYGSTHRGMKQGNQFVDRVVYKDGQVKKEIGQTKVYLARGDNPVDALVSGVLTDAPVLLLGPDGSVPEATAAYLKKHLPTHFVALGGEKAVPTDSFLKAEFDPLKQNVWTNNEAVKSAKEAKAYAEFLLKGAYEGATGINPAVREVKEARTLTEDERAQQAKYRKELGDLKADLAPATDDSEGGAFVKNLKDTKAAAKTAAQTDNTNKPAGDEFGGKKYKEIYDDIAAKKEKIDGKGTRADAEISKRGEGNYSGSQEALNRANLNLSAAERTLQIKTDIDAAVAAYKSVGNSPAAKKNKAAKDLYEVVSKYLTKFYYSNGTSKEDVAADTMVAGAVGVSAVADKFVATWETATYGGLAGFADTANATLDTTATGLANAKQAFDPTADYTTDKVLGKKLGTGTTTTEVKYQGVAAEIPNTTEEKIATLRALVTTAKNQLDSDKQDLEKAEELWEDALAKYNESDTVQAKAYRLAMTAKANAEARVKQLEGMLDGNTGTVDAFMGYEKLEQRYKAVYDAYNYLKASKDSAIRSKVRDLIAQGTTSPADVVANLSVLVKEAYGVDLTLTNVRDFFAFQQVGGVLKVTNPILAKLAKQNDALTGVAVELINEFYTSPEGKAFDKGDMRAWFANGHYKVDVKNGLYQTTYANTNKQGLAEQAADVIVRAVDYSDAGLEMIPGGTDSVTRVSAYLERIAQANRDTAATMLAKAIEELQKALDKVLPKRYDRIDGKDRYDTSAAIAGYWRAAYVYEGGVSTRKDNVEPLDIYIANGDTYIDAVAGGQLKKGPIVLVNSEGKLTDAVKQRFAYAKTDTRLLTIYALGGGKAVSDSVLVDAKAAAFDKSWLGKDLFSNATKKAADNAKDEKKAEDKKADEKKADDKK